MWFLTRNCVSEDHRIRVTVTLFARSCRGRWEDTLVHPCWRACSFLCLGRFRSSRNYFLLMFQLGSSILQKPFLPANTWISCHLSMFLVLVSITATNAVPGRCPHWPWERNAIFPIAPRRPGPRIEPTVTQAWNKHLSTKSVIYVPLFNTNLCVWLQPTNYFKFYLVPVFIPQSSEKLPAVWFNFQRVLSCMD